ncbi:MAG: 3-oxoadipate enol-lactonase [Candidatus Azotimanducaceae bacterium]|jgi:3-oxoadipate enol-lactonase
MSAIDVSYRIKGQGPALYLVHGIGSRKTTWDELVDGLKDSFTCVDYDLRGHGESPIPPTPYTLDDMVDDLEALRQKLGHEKIHIAGHSLGGMIGPAYARAYPERTLSVALLSTAAGRSDDDRAKLQAVSNAMEKNGIAETLGTFTTRWFTDAFIEAHPEKIEARLQQVSDTPPDVFRSVFWIYATTEMAPWLHEIEHPCLVLTGEFDGGCNPQLNQLIHEKLPVSRLIILKDLKHSLMIEASDRVLPHLKDFFLSQG